MTTDAISIVRAFLEAENARDWDAWSKLLAADVTYELVGSSRVIRGRQSYVAHMQRVYAKLPDWQFTLANVAAASQLVMVEFHGSGHFSGLYKDHRYSQVPLSLAAVCVFELLGSQISLIREYFDYAGYEAQLNAALPQREGA